MSFPSLAVTKLTCSFFRWWSWWSKIL